MERTPEDRFIDLLGQITQAEGNPRIFGQIMAYLVLAGEARSLTEIAEALGVSKASVSTNVRLLETRGMAVREGRKGSRQDHWRLLPRPHKGVLTTMSERFRRNAEQIDGIAVELPDSHADTRNKIADFAEFYRGSAEFLKSWAEALDEHGAAQASDASLPQDETNA